MPIRADRNQASLDFAGWRVNYDRSLFCGLVMAPQIAWSSDRAPQFKLPPMVIFKIKAKLYLESETF